jgi:hypothetical protein
VSVDLVLEMLKVVVWIGMMLVDVGQLVEVGGMEEVVGGVGYEIEPVSGGVDSTLRSVAEELRSAPESELETADSWGHLHKIGQEIP